MKITIVQGAFLPVPPLMGGAVEKVWFALGREFVKRGHTVTHISRQYNDLPHQEEIEGVQHRRIPGYDTPSTLVKLKILDLFYSLRAVKALPEADILITNTFWLPILVRSARYGALYVNVNRYPKGQMRLYRHARRLQPVSTAIAEAIVREAPSCAPLVRLIPNPLPFTINSEGRPEGGPGQTKSILYVGRIHPEKGIDLLLDAFQKLPALGCEAQRLAIVGPWETRFGGGGEDYYRSLRGRAGADNREVEWVGPVFDAAQLSRHYQAADIFVYPSLAENGEALPVAPIEAMAHGCPPVVSALRCFQDYVRDGECGFIFDHRGADGAQRLAGILRALLQSDSVRTNAGRAAQETARRFQPAEVARMHLEDFETVLARA